MADPPSAQALAGDRVLHDEVFKPAARLPGRYDPGRVRPAISATRWHSSAASAARRHSIGYPVLPTASAATARAAARALTGNLNHCQGSPQLPSAVRLGGLPVTWGCLRQVA